jgi:hypothetical protein
MPKRTNRLGDEAAGMQAGADYVGSAKHRAADAVGDTVEVGANADQNRTNEVPPTPAEPKVFLGRAAATPKELWPCQGSGATPGPPAVKS